MHLLTLYSTTSTYQDTGIALKQFPPLYESQNPNTRVWKNRRLDKRDKTIDGAMIVQSNVAAFVEADLDQKLR